MTASAFELNGEVALISGGGTGLGLGMARCMVDAGAKVVLLGRREAPLKEAVESLGEAAHYRVQDVRDESALPGMLASVQEQVGPVSIVINNAGVHLKKPATETSLESFQQVIETHVLGGFALTQAALPGMLERGTGSILFIASMASLIGIPQVVAYSAAKSAYLGMVRSLAAELSPEGIRVNAIAPGWIESPMLRQALNGDEARSNKILGRTPLARFGEPDDIGNAAVYLSSPAARFVTGVVLPVDGGASIGF
ncbi:SDR family NAD(P)-dependent oxidoreductase [Phycisphaerales bacterium AB-hyl4]|uniref:SDR family NAD(P)-dependent oxidoreductase n=1 Tax=Natronomicrosphaera hydrolytica TaxID=3242702 RepID=A0ABV4U9B7_9BACT